MGEVIQMAARQRGDPQIEDGFLKVANELAEAMSRTVFSPNESQLIWCIIRLTYGYNKKSARIPTQTWTDLTGMKATHVYRTLKRLVARNVVTRAGPKGAYRWSIQKHYKKWEVVTMPGPIDQGWSQVRTKGGQSPIISERQLKDRGSCPQCGGPKKEEWHKLCDECYRNPQIQPDRYAGLPDCPNCTTKSFDQRIDSKVGGCNFCKPMEVE
jgi:phage replication O-like protein O